MNLEKCMSCQNEIKMTDMNPVWNLYEPKYPPRYICKSCQPERTNPEDTNDDYECPLPKRSYKIKVRICDVPTPENK